VPTTVGYSGTPLPQKLGIKPGHRLLLLGAPAGFLDDDLGPLPPGVHVLRRAAAPVDVAVAFAVTRRDLASRFAAARTALAADGGLWVAYPKKAAKVPTELDFTSVQEHGLDAGLVDNKSCAVTEVWSGLRFVVRVADRAAWPVPPSGPPPRPSGRGSAGGRGPT
jgi:hypothetical protein